MTPAEIVKSKSTAIGLKSFTERGLTISVGRYSYGVPALEWKSSDKNVRLSIGAFCSIGDNVRIFLGTAGRHTVDFVSTYPLGLIYGRAPQSGLSSAHAGDLSVSLGSDVWIGRNVTILAGVNIGHGAVIATGAVVTKNIAPYTIVGGVPAKLLKSRFDSQIIEKLLRLKWWDWDDDKIKERLSLFATPSFEGLLDEFLTQDCSGIDGECGTTV